MNICSHIIFTVLTIYLFLAIHVICFGYKPCLSRLFLWATLCLFAWSLGSLLIYYAATSDACWIWYRVTSFGQCFFSSAILHFYLVLTKKDALLKKWWIYALLYIPPLLLLYGFLFDNVIVGDFIIAGMGHMELTIVHSFWYFYYILLHMTYFLTAIIMLLHWRAKLKYFSEKKQALAIILPFIMSMLSVFFIGIVLRNFNKTDLLMLTPVTSFFGTVGTWYATVKYKLMVLTPSLAVENILDIMVDSVVLVDSDLRILTVNNETCRLLKYEEKELVGRELNFLFNGDEIMSKSNVTNLLENGPIRNYELKYMTKDRKAIPVVFSASEYKDKDNKLIGIVIISRDITEHKNVEERLKHLAHHDFLTGLPNRLLFTDRLEQALVRAYRYSTIAAVILLDVDGFKEVNDALGHNSGDNLLIEVAGRLKLAIRRIDTIARLGGDEFIFIINDLKSADDVKEVADKIQKAFLSKFIIGSHELHVTASIGISLYPFDGNDADTLIKNADLAMYHAKNQGKNSYQLFTNPHCIINTDTL